MRLPLITRTKKYALMQSLYWTSNCTLYGFATVFLLANNIPIKNISMIIAVINTLSVLMQCASSWFLKKYHDRLTLKMLVCGMTGITVLFSVFLLITPTGTAALIIVLFSLISIINISLQPLISSIAMECINRGFELDFSAARGCGSVIYGSFAYLLGLLLTKTDIRILPALYVLFGICLFFSVHTFKIPKLRIEAEICERLTETAETKGPGFLSFLVKNKYFIMLLIGIACCIISNRMIATYLIKIVERIGGNSKHMGVSIAIACIVEFPCMFYYNRLLRFFKCETLFKISALFFTLKAAGILFAPNIPLFYAVNLLQVFSYSLFAPSMVYYINKVMSDEDKIIGQVAGVTAMTAGDILGSLIIAALPGGGSVTLVLTLAVICAAVGFLLFMVFIKPIRTNTI